MNPQVFLRPGLDMSFLTLEKNKWAGLTKFI